MPPLVDLRSDTVTRPSDGMRAAMAAADVGDDVYGEDPTINRLQERVAELFGREAALLVPSGVMANQVSLRVFARPGTEVVTEADSHLVNYEDGAGALLAGVQYRTVPTTDGLLTADAVEAAIRPDDFHLTPTSLVTVEQTHNRRGGTVYPLEQLQAIAQVTTDHGVGLYLDGARIFNASAASGVPVAEYAAVVTGLMFSMSKGLGAPVGSLVIGDAAAITEAARWRRRYGGAMRQAGVLAAAGLYALEHNVDRLADDHANAQAMGQIIADAAPDAVDLRQIQTNMVYVDTGITDAGVIAEELLAEGVVIGAMGSSTIRLVTHLDVEAEGCRRAAEGIARRLAA